MRPQSFVYLPWVAQISGALIRHAGERFFFTLYLTVFVLAMAAMTLLPLLGRGIPGHRRDKLPFAALMTGSAFMWGNIAVILHGLLLIAAVGLEATSWWLVVAIVVAAWVKPVFLSYLAVIALADISLPRKATLAATGIVAGVLPTLLFATSGTEAAHEWLNLLAHFVCDRTPGYGFLGWLDMVGVNGRSLPAQMAWIAFAALLMACAWTLSEALQLGRQERLWLGLCLACLLIPRIMSQDVFLLAPGLIVLAQRSPELVRRTTGKFAAAFLAHGKPILLGLCTLALAGGLSGLNAVTLPLSLLGFSLYILALGLPVLGGFALRFMPRQRFSAAAAPEIAD